MNRKILSIIVILSLFVIPSISAYSNWGGYGFSPLDYFQGQTGQWVMFMIYFIFFFAVIYYTTNKSFKNQQVAAVIGASLALFIALAMAQRGWLDYYMSAEIGAWALLIAALIAIGFALKFSYETFGRIGAVASILIIWYILWGYRDNPGEILPPELLTETFMNVYMFISSIFGLVIILIISAILITARKNRGFTGFSEGFDRFFGR